MSFKTLSCLILLLSLTACTRDSKNSSKMRIRLGNASSKVGAMSTPIPAGYKVCYAANVTAGDIPASPRSCGTSLGAFGGFVEAGGLLEVSVPKGSGRKVDLYAYLTPNTSAACPALNTACEVATSCNTYKVATVEGVNMSGDQTEVSMNVDFPGLTANAVSQEAPSSMICSANIAAGLTYSGQIVDGSFALIGAAPNSPANYTVYRKISNTTFDVVTRSGMASESVSFVVRPQIRALSIEPAGGQLYGLLSDGTMVSVNSSGDYATITTCPFSTCTLPRWFKSFAFGPGQKVFGLDHGGGLWRVDDTTTLVSVTTLPPYVHQVVFQ